MNDSAIECRQDDELGFVLEDSENDDAWVSAEATVDVTRIR